MADAGRVLKSVRRLRADLGRRVPPVRRLIEQRDRLAAELAETRSRPSSTGDPFPDLYPPGHFYSPVPDLGEIRRRDAAIFRDRDAIPGIDLRAAEQLQLAAELGPLAAAWPFAEAPGHGLRYGYVNDYFGSGDGIVAHCLLRRWQPKRLIEVGSGFSSALILDTNDRFLDGSLECTFVEPYPDRLNALLRESDRDRARILECPVQDVDPGLFAELEPGDVLFVDSSHVVKIGSDVNLLLLEIVPTLAPGVYVHVHDIVWPFEYSRAWVYEGRAWSEAYLLHALLINNAHLEIVWFQSYLQAHFSEEVGRLVPGWSMAGGTSMWLQTR